MLRFVIDAIMVVFALMYTLISLHACAPTVAAPAQTPVQGVPISPGAEHTPNLERGIVNILQSRAEISLPLQQAIDMYTTHNPDALINVHTVSGATDYRIALRTRLLAGGRVDIFHVFSGIEARELSPFLEDLSHLEWISDTMESLADPVSFDGGVYGIPYSLEAIGIIANRNIFEVAGIPLMDIVDFGNLERAMDELAELIIEEEITRHFPSLRNVTDFPMQDRDYLGRIASGILLMGEFEYPSQATVANNVTLPFGTRAESFFELMRRHSPSGDWVSRDGLSYLYQLEDFAAGRTALLLSDMDGMLRILEMNPELEGRIELIPIPLPGGGRGAIHTFTPLWWSVNAESSDATRQSSADFLTWLYTSEQGSAVVAARFGAQSAFPDSAKETGLSIHRQTLSLVQRGHSTPAVWREAPPEWPGMFTTGLRLWYTGEHEWDEMLVDLRELWTFR